MATKYLRSGASGSADGSNMTNAYTTLDAAIAGIAAGDTLLVASDHSENYTADKTFTFPGTITSPNLIQSVDATTLDYEPGALVTATGNFNMTINGFYHNEGVNFSFAIGNTVAKTFQICGAVTGQTQKLKDLTLTIPAFTNSRILTGGPGSDTIFDNVTVANGNANGGVRPTGRFTWKNSTPFTGTAPTNLLDTGASSGVLTMDGCDLTFFNGKQLVANSSTITSTLRLINCELPTSFTVYGTVSPGSRTSIINCSDSTGALRREEHSYSGASTLVTNVYRTGGASDAEASYSNKMVTTAGASRFWPLASLDLAFNVAAADVGVSKTLTAYLLSSTTDGSAGVTLAANEAWIEIDYLADSGSLDSATATSGPTDGRATGTTPATDGVSTWTTTGLTSPVKQTVSKAFTPAKAGMHRARVMLAKATTMTFVDLKMVLS